MGSDWQNSEIGKRHKIIESRIESQSSAVSSLQLLSEDEIS